MVSDLFPINVSLPHEIPPLVIPSSVHEIVNDPFLQQDIHISLAFHMFGCETDRFQPSRNLSGVQGSERNHEIIVIINEIVHNPYQSSFP